MFLSVCNRVNSDSYFNAIDNPRTSDGRTSRVLGARGGCRYTHVSEIRSTNFLKSCREMLTGVSNFPCNRVYRDETKHTYDLACENVPRELSFTTVCGTFFL